MAIEFRCECGETLQVEDELAGKRGRCPSCGKVIVVPDKDPEPLELKEEITEEARQAEKDALEPDEYQRPTSELETVEKSMNEWSSTSLAKRFLADRPRPLLLIVPGVIVLLVVLFFVLKPGSQRPSGPMLAAKPGDKSSVRETPKVAPEQEKKVEVAPSPPIKVESPVPQPPTPAPSPKEEKPMALAPVEAKPSEGTASSRPEDKALPQKDQTKMAKKSPAPRGGFTVSVGAFKEKSRADRYVEELKRQGLDAFTWTSEVPGKGTWYRVSIGSFSTQKQAEEYAKELQEKRKLKTYVVQLSPSRR